MHARAGFVEFLARHFRAHPEELARLLLDAARLRFSLPISAISWLVDRRNARRESGLRFEVVPPGLRVYGTLELMGTPVQAAASIFVDRIDFAPGTAKIELRLVDIEANVHADVKTSVAALVRSGALDLTKAGSLAAQLPDIQALLGESRENRLVIDLFKHPRFAENRSLRRALELLSSIATVRGIEADDGGVHLALRALPFGVRGAARALRRQLRPAP